MSRSSGCARRSARVSAKVLDVVRSAVSAGGWSAGQRSALEREVGRLDEIILLAQAKLAALANRPTGRGWRWLQLLEIELAIERIQRIALEDPVKPAERPALLQQIASIEAGPRRARPQASAGRLAGALEMLGHVLDEAPEREPDNQVSAPPTAPQAGWRPALQTAAAAIVAIVAGQLLLPDRWYWAAFAAFVMFQGTRSRGESIAKGVAFVVGTSAGLVAGVLLATLIGAHAWLSVAAIVIAVFLMFQAFTAAYAVMVFWLTVILGLMFGILGYFTFDVLLLRLEELAIGVAAGVVVASLVAVRREEDVTREAATSFLRALRDLVRITGLVLIESKPVPELASLILGVEQRFREFSAVAASQQSGFGFAHDDTLHKRVTVLDACGGWGRELGTMGLDGARIEDRALARTAGRIATRVDATLGRLIGEAPSAEQSGPGAGRGDEVVPAGPDDSEHRAVRLLLRLDAALAGLASARATGRKA